MRGFIKRRGEREPLQHILGSTSFCGLEIAVNRDVLIPRPETELLAERAWDFLNQQASRQPQPPRALDFGTGSGCLAIALAVHCPTVEIHATDISAAAIAVARQNALRHQVGERVRFHTGEHFAALPSELRFDLLVGNPPYIPAATSSTCSRKCGILIRAPRWTAAPTAWIFTGSWPNTRRLGWPRWAASCWNLRRPGKRPPGYFSAAGLAGGGD